VDIQIAGRHVDVTEQMDRHIREHIDRLPPYAGKAQYLTVTLAVESGSQIAEIIARCNRTDFVAQASSHDMYQSIDGAFQKLERQLTRHHDKLVHGRAREAQKEAH